jgi:hypothetical protein
VSNQFRVIQGACGLRADWGLRADVGSQRPVAGPDEVLVLGAEWRVGLANGRESTPDRKWPCLV